MISFKEYRNTELLLESTPPGMEGWVMQHKPYYSKNKKMLYSTSWKLFWEVVKKHIGKAKLKGIVDFSEDSPKILNMKKLEQLVSEIKDSEVINLPEKE
ncbi:MAG: hypothetical protein KC589_06545 [Nanoarchaeota archaeon]|nr:hypothetical protein [Nanoarchaeota archaeon]